MAVFAIILVSCQKNENEKYSCNEDVNDWVIRYKSSFVDITRDQLATLPIEYQQAVFRSLSDDHKAEIWISKLDMVANNQIGNDTLIGIINILKNNCTSELFKTENYMESLNYLDNMQDLILQSIDFDSVLFILNFASISFEDELNEVYSDYISIDYTWLEDTDGILMEPPGGTLKCKCKWDITCSLINMGHCDDGYNNCQTTSGGCGLLWMYDCTGGCDGELPD